MSLRRICHRTAGWTALVCAGMCWLPGCVMLTDDSSPTSHVSLKRHEPVPSAPSEPIGSEPISQASLEQADSPEFGSYHYYNTLPGQQSGNVVVRYNPRTGITHTHLPGSAMASPMPSPYQTKFLPLKPDPRGARCSSASSISTPANAETLNEDFVVMLPATIYTPSAPTQCEATIKHEVIAVQATAVEESATVAFID